MNIRQFKTEIKSRLRPVEEVIGNLLWNCNFAKDKTVVFVVGSQRSGTGMILKVLDRSPQTGVHLERKNSRAYDENFRIRSEGVIRFLMCTSRREFTVLKPLNDLQHIDTLLNFHPNAKAIWAYREWQGVVNSACHKWGNGWRDIIYAINSGKLTTPGRKIMGERVSGEARSLIERFCAENLTAQDGAALLWYLRNSVFFDLGLQSRPEVAVCKYKYLVSEPALYFKRLFDFIGCRFSSEYIRIVNVSSLDQGGGLADSVRPEIKSVCEDMIRRLDTVFLASERPSPAIDGGENLANRT